MKKNVNESDLNSVAQWLSTTIDNMEVEYKKESMLLYEKDAKDMYNSYEEYPQDKKRTDKIIKLLKNGKEILPLYVEKNDKCNFVMEGRHRMVAFYLLGYEEIIVARCSIKKVNKIIF